MIFRSGVFSRRPGLTSDQFTKHWIEGHGPLARPLPEMHAYFQHHIVERIHEKLKMMAAPPGQHAHSALTPACTTRSSPTFPSFIAH
jgi:hypothetical protein